MINLQADNKKILICFEIQVNSGQLNRGLPFDQEVYLADLDLQTRDLK